MKAEAQKQPEQVKPQVQPSYEEKMAQACVKFIESLSRYNPEERKRLIQTACVWYNIRP